VTGSESVDSLRGMGWRHPVVAWAMIAFLVSLTGLPPTVGFYGKLLLFYECVDSGLGWLVFVAALNSVISLFYYFRVAKAMFLTDPEERVRTSQPLLAGFLALLGLGTVLTGIWAKPLQDWSTTGQQSLGVTESRD
jgi:NADH-quinone oxidoreductase subunit N